MDILGMGQGRFNKQEITQRKCPFAIKSTLCYIFSWNIHDTKPNGDIFTSKCNQNDLNFDGASPHDQLKIMLNLKIREDLIPQAVLFVSTIYKARYKYHKDINVVQHETGANVKSTISFCVWTHLPMKQL